MWEMMQELSLNILDIAQNSIKAEADLIKIEIHKNPIEHTMRIVIEDNGRGMTKEQVERVENPFFTTRTTRKVGLGVPFFKMSAEMTGGNFHIDSEIDVGTTVVATYRLDHIDLMPLGDMASTMVTLISVNPDIDFIYTYGIGENQFSLDTREVRVILEGMPVNSPPVLSFIKEFIEENTKQVNEI